MRDYFDVSNTEPGCDENPNDWETVYNPFRYAYPMILDTDFGRVEIMVQFFIEGNDQRDKIEFNHDGAKYELPIFPTAPECSLKPIDGPVPNFSGYQMGESRYHFAPGIVRARTINGDESEVILGADGYDNLIPRDVVERLITPKMLDDAIRAFRNEVGQDSMAPVDLCDLLDNYCNGCSAIEFDHNDEDE